MNSVTICNLALSMLGSTQITSFEDAKNTSANLCKTFYPILRDRVLRDHTWSFATFAAALEQLNEASIEPELPLVCALPGDVIRVIGITPEGRYRRQGKRLLVASLPAQVVYIRRVEDADEFDATFVEALQFRIAAELAMANTRDAAASNFYMQQYEAKLAVARAIDSQENLDACQPGPRRSNWIASRFAGYGGSGTGPLKFTEGNAGRS